MTKFINSIKAFQNLCLSPDTLLKPRRRSASSSSVPAPFSFSFQSIAIDTHDFHGDDAIGKGRNYIIVADGVSGTKVSSGPLAKALITEISLQLNILNKFIEDQQRYNTKLTTKTSTSVSTTSVEDFLPLLRKHINNGTIEARKQVKHLGRLDAALLVTYFDLFTRRLYTYSIGDCKCLLVRNRDSIIFESTSIIYDFNVPGVVSTDNVMNCVQHAKLETSTYEPSDQCYVCSDGISDNLFVQNILQMSKEYEVTETEQITKALVNRTKELFSSSASKQYVPFALGAALTCEQAATSKIEYLNNLLTLDHKTNEEELKEELKMAKAFLNFCHKLPVMKAKDQGGLFREEFIGNIDYYTLEQLLYFSNKLDGKEDDISLCLAVLN